MGTAALGAQTASVQPRASALARWMRSGQAKWGGMALGLRASEAGALMLPDQSGTRATRSGMEPRAGRNEGRSVVERRVRYEVHSDNAQGGDELI